MQIFAGESIDFGLSKYLSIIFPRFEKQSTLKSLDRTIKGIKQNVGLYGSVDSRMYRGVITQNYTDLTNALSDSIASCKDVVARSKKSAIKSYHGDLIALIEAVSDNLVTEHDKIASAVTRVYDETVQVNNIDYQRANLLVYIGLIPHFNNYARRLLLTMTNDLLGDTVASSPVDAADRVYIKDIKNVQAFAKALVTFSLPFGEVFTAFENGKGIQYDEKSAYTVYTQNGGKVDPFKMRLLPIVGDIVLMFGRLNNLRIASDQEIIKEECDKLSVTIMLLKRKTEKAVDPTEIEKLNKQIAYYSNRINKLRGSLELIES